MSKYVGSVDKGNRVYDEDYNMIGRTSSSGGIYYLNNRIASHNPKWEIFDMNGEKIAFKDTMGNIHSEIKIRDWCVHVTKDFVL